MPVVEGGRDEVILGVGRPIVELNAQDVVTGDLAQRLQPARAPREMPGVNRHTAVVASGRPHHVPRRLQIGDTRPWEELEVHDEAMLGGPIAEPGESVGRVVEVPFTTEYVDGVDRPGANGLADPEQLLLAETEDLLLVVSRRERSRHLRRPR
jgi:hypothetical protein